jgi:hypothetical protein
MECCHLCQQVEAEWEESRSFPEGGDKIEESNPNHLREVKLSLAAS